mmetsp:Transcript_16423/g.27832  ORF Transcript_16423/g.27832 Transcript_16423/m.27832 type:complete len:263 (+) Transcript_16423:1055-1843(+)
MNQAKVKKVDCKVCKLIYDYTRICKHDQSPENTQKHLQNWADQQAKFFQQQQNQDRNMKTRIDSLKELMITLDAMSTVRETAYIVVQGQFSDVLTLFLRNDLNQIMGDSLRRSCKICASIDHSNYANKEAIEKLKIMEHALLILNRCLIFQLNGLITNSQEDKVVLQMLKETQSFQYGASEMIEMCVQDEFRLLVEATVKNIEQQNLSKKLKQASSQAQQAESDNKVRFTTLNLLTQAYVNMLILSPNQKTLMQTILKQRQV